MLIRLQHISATRREREREEEGGNEGKWRGKMAREKGEGGGDWFGLGFHYLEVSIDRYDLRTDLAWSISNKSLLMIGQDLFLYSFKSVPRAGAG